MSELLPPLAPTPQTWQAWFRFVLSLFAPTKKLGFVLLALVLGVIIVTGRAERQRRNAVLATTSKQLDLLEGRLQQEIDLALLSRGQLQAEIDRLERRVAQLEREH